MMQSSPPCVLGYAEQFTGKVVGISDGDTLSILREGKAVKVRLHSVDTPEKAQAFGTQARQFTGELVFQRDVTVVVQGTDRYGRDKTSLDVFWLKDKNLTDLDNLPEPDELAAEIIDNVEAGLNSFRAVLGSLEHVA
jgi:Staphylococcal nuclease homologue